MVLVVVLFFFFKQKTAYEMRISDWSSDVCSSDLKRQQNFWRIVSDQSRESIMIRSPEAIQPFLPICAVVAGNNMTVTSERQQSLRLFLPIEIDHKARGSPEYSSTTELLRQHPCYFGHADVERDMIVRQPGMNGQI